MIVVKVRNRDISAAALGPVTAGSQGLPVKWHFNCDWADLTKIAVFRVGSVTAPEVVILDDLCAVPNELLNAQYAGENLFIGVYGRDISGKIAMPTVWAWVRIEDGAEPLDPEPPDPTPNWKEQLIAAADEALQTTKSLRNDMDAFLDSAEAYAKGPLTFLALSLTPALAEKGSTVDELSISWILNRAPDRLLIDGVETEAAERGHVALPVELTADHSVTLTALSSARVGEEPERVEKSAELRFVNSIFYGAAAAPQALDSAFLASLSGRELSDEKGRRILVTAGAGQYIWYALPARLGGTSFRVSSVTGGFEAPETVSYTNPSGYTENYLVYRSSYPALGETELLVDVDGGGTGSGDSSEIDVYEAVADYFTEHPVSADVADYFTEHPVSADIAAWFDEHPLAADFVTPEMFYAGETTEIGGTTYSDYTNAIQAAVDTGKSVKFAKKTYVITSPIILDSNFTQRVGLVYDGGGCTISHPDCDALCLSSLPQGYPAGADGVPLNGLRFCIIQNFRFLGQNRTKTAVYVEGQRLAAGSNYVRQCVIRNCRFEKEDRGMYFCGQLCSIEQCYFFGCNTGITDDASNFTVYQNNYFHSCENTGLNLNAPTQCLVSCNYFYCNRIGLLCGSEGASAGCSIHGNKFEVGTDPVRYKQLRFIKLLDVSDAVVSANYMEPLPAPLSESDSRCAIEIQNCRRVAVTDNFCVSIPASNRYGVLYIHSGAGRGAGISVKGGSYGRITVSMAENELNISNVKITENLGSRSADENGRTDRYINAENVQAGGLGTLRLKNASLTTAGTQYFIRTMLRSVEGSAVPFTYRLKEDTENSTLKWELLT